MVFAEVTDYLKLLPTLTQEKNIWLSYDQEADVLYVSFKKSATATDSELTDEDVIIRYQDDEVIGMTILHASQRD